MSKNTLTAMDMENESGLPLMENEYKPKGQRYKNIFRRELLLVILTTVAVSLLFLLYVMIHRCPSSDITIIDVEMTPTYDMPETTVIEVSITDSSDSINENTPINLAAVPGGMPRIESLTEQLDCLVFKNYGVVRNSDKFTWKTHPCHYLEAQNVTGPYMAWAEVGTCTYMYQDIGGTLVHPPSGMRSSVPLGGISTGMFELRGDGKFHEWTIFNQYPAGAGKIQVMDDMFMAVRTQVNEVDGEVVAKVLQTSPRLEGLPGVKSLGYRGSYPVSKLSVDERDFPVDVSVYAYSWYKHGDMNTSATPAVALTAMLHNPSDTEEYNASFMINLPIGIERDTQRVSPQMPKLTPFLPASEELEDPSSSYKYTTLLFSDIEGNLTLGKERTLKLDKSSGKDPIVECFKECTGDCYTWTYDEAGQTCYTHFDHARMNGHKENFYAGVKTNWSKNSECLTVNRDTPEFSTNGNMSLCAYSSDSEYKYSLGASNDIIKLWDEFSHTGEFQSAPTGHHVSGAVSSQVMLKPGETKEMTVVLGWYFPDRDFLGIPVGNYYTEYLVKDSADAARKLGTNLQEAVSDARTLHSAYFDTNIPETFQDMLLNSLSHIRSAFWLKDGRWRQWEAYDCVNMDSVHNDGERHIPYLMIFPESTINKLYAWAGFQEENGMIPEEVRCGCWGLPIYPITVEYGCGRDMVDGSSMFIVYLLELLQHHPSPDSNEVVHDLWQNAKRAAQWHMSVSAETGLPRYLTTTYDVLHLNAYPYAAYSGAFHLLAMKAAEQLALHMNDTDFAIQCEEAFIRGQLKLDELHWNETAQYYNAYVTTEEEFDESAFFTNGLRMNLCAYPQYHREEWGECVEGYPTTPGAIMTDTFYAQVLAYTLGLGTLVREEDRLKKHMMAELDYNDSPYGMLLMTGRYPYPGPYTDNAVWMMGNPNWASIALHLGLDHNLAMEVGTKAFEIWKDTLHDMWNVAGVLGGVGYGADSLPFITSHYGYYMSSWHFPMALSGQKLVMNSKNITFSPKIPPPYKLPVMLPSVWGVLESQIAPLNTNTSSASPEANVDRPYNVYYNLTLHFGQVDTEHLSVNNCPHGKPMTLAVGRPALWNCRYT